MKAKFMVQFLTISVGVGLLLIQITSGLSAESAHRIVIPVEKNMTVERASSTIDYLAAQVEVQAEFVPSLRSLYGGGDGSTFEQAIIIHAPNAKVGMKAETLWLEARFPGHRPHRLLPLKRGSRVHHQVEIIAVDGMTNKVFFEASEFYGKAPRLQPFMPPPKEFIVGGHRLRFAGGDGSSIEKAVIIAEAPDHMTGILSEYFWLATRVPDYRLTKQALLGTDDRHFDRLDVVASDGNNYSFYFDITGFWGK